MAKAKSQRNTALAVEPIQAQAEAVEVTDHRTIRLPITREQLDTCIETHRNQLAHLIQNRNSPPIDGGVMKMVAALDALARVEPTEGS